MSQENSEAVKPARLEFIAHHLPALEDGDYTLTVAQEVTVDGAVALAPDATRQEVLFAVWGPRFSLDPQLIRSVFPPDKSMGEYDNVLPHVILDRTTLPWERSVDGTPPSQQTNPVPWLALLLFDDDEAARITTQTLTVGDVLDHPANGFPALPRESGQSAEDRVQVIDVPGEILKRALPKLEDLPFLAHIRQGKTADDRPAGAETPVVLGCRLPRPGSGSVVHLVSLEGRKSDLLDGRDALGSAPVRLVTLKSWRFASLPAAPTFTEVVEACHREPYELRLPDPPAGAPGAAAARLYVRQGYVAAEHRTRQGNRLVSWYRGPLLPAANPGAALDVAGLPRTADELVRYHRRVGMLDVSYAAAWELGRLLTLQSRRVALALFQWKRARAQDEARWLEARHLPHTARLQRRHRPAPLPDAVRQWMASLALLEPVPFPYLVPREEMLPAESIRFFQVDPVWLRALLDGAFSIGRVLRSAPQADAQLAAEVIPPLDGVVSGFLLRSHAVAGWPDLGVEGYLDAVPASSTDFVANQAPAPLVRRARLAPGVLLCLFRAGRAIQTVDLHRHPESIHFGVELDGGRTRKALRDPQSGELKATVDVPWMGAADERAVDVSRLIQEAKGQGLAITSAADFGVAMIEGVDKVRFTTAGA